MEEGIADPLKIKQELPYDGAIVAVGIDSELIAGPEQKLVC